MKTQRLKKKNDKLDAAGCVIGITIVVTSILGLARAVFEFGGFWQALKASFEGTVSTLWYVVMVLTTGLAVFTLLLLVSLVFSRWRRVSVFVSYSSEDECRAEDVARRLSNLGIKGIFIPSSICRHDDVIGQIRTGLRQCSVFMAFPANRLGFYEAEILAACVAGKPVILLIGSEERQLPNTAFRGYPVFDLDALDEQAFLPLKHFVECVTHHWRETFRIGKRSWYNLWPRVGILSAAMFVFDFVAEPLLILIVGLESYMSLHQTVLSILAAAFSIALCGCLVVSFARQRRAINVTRQSIITGAFHTILSKSFNTLPSDKNIRECLLDEPLSVKHREPADNQISSISNTTTKQNRDSEPDVAGLETPLLKDIKNDICPMCGAEMSH